MVVELPISGSWLIDIKRHEDLRGNFHEWLPYEAIHEITGKPFSTAQANFSSSKKGTIRGIHYSVATEGQSKIVTCFSGAIWDVVVDLRRQSPTFGKWHGELLAADTPKSLYISAGLGHGFMALEDDSCIAYLLSSRYQPSLEHGINPFDSDLAIDWPIGDYIVSEKDQLGLQFAAMKKLLK
jgi:dTDP-4-dehydrorhamnose 3,5-epimerase